MLQEAGGITAMVIAIWFGYEMYKEYKKKKEEKK